MTRNQVAYHDLVERKRANRAKEAIDTEKNRLEGTEIARKKERDKWDILWRPFETISNNSAKILGGML